MRRLFTLCLLFISVACYSQTNNNLATSADGNSITLPFKKKKTCFYVCSLVRGLMHHDSSGYKIMQTTSRGCYIGNADPLIVLDGNPLLVDPDDSMNKTSVRVNINDIKSIEILKNAAATALYGYEAFNGVVIITTKGPKIRKFIIKDFLDDSRLSGATVSFTSATDKNEKFQFVADDSGFVITDKLDRPADYKMMVSAVGHVTLEQVFENSYNTETKEILLAREIKTCPEVVLTPTQCWKTVCRLGYRVIVTRIKAVTEAKEKASFTIFPNPISKGGTLNIKFKTIDNEMKRIRVLSPDGSLLLTTQVHTDKTDGSFQIQTDTRWSAGIYFIQLLYENGQVAASQKIIIQ